MDVKLDFHLLDCHLPMALEMTAGVSGCRLPVIAECCQTEGTGSGKRGVAAEQFRLMVEGHMKHELLLTVLLIPGTFRVGCAVWSDDEKHFLPPLGWFRARLSRYGVVLDKMECHTAKVGSGWLMDIVVDS